MVDSRGKTPESLGTWFHNIHLPDGAQTAPDHWLGDFPSYKWQAIAPHLPNDLSGWNVLDIGCNGGFYSIEFAKRGAEVLAIDIDGRYLEQARWAVNAFALQDHVTVHQMEVYEVVHLAQDFDLICFMGVFYHLRYPLLALDILAEKVRRLLLFQTLTLPETDAFEPYQDYPFDQREVMLQPGWPKLAFIEHKFANDPTNWWVPNPSCVKAMLRSAGFEIVQCPAPETYLCKPAAARRVEYQRDGRSELDAVFGPTKSESESDPGA